MPRVRKETSRRGTTKRRSEIKKKVSESRKKSKKAAKKDVTWKSKTQKDPGIPNNFPYKDRILAEVAEQRRLAAEEKQRRKDENRANKGQKATAGAKDTSDRAASLEPGDASGFDGIITLGSSRLSGKEKEKAPTVAAADDAEDDVPILINPELPNLQSVLDRADVVVEVLDARDPLAYRSSALEAYVQGKPGKKLLFVLNKIDTCPREVVASWASQLRAFHPTVMFRSASPLLPSTSPTPDPKGKKKQPVNDAWGAGPALEQLRQWAQEKSGDEPLDVAIVGLTNAGKSSFINSLLRRTLLPIYMPSSSSRGPTTTTHAQEVSLDSIRLIDTPGIAWDYSGAADEPSEQREGLRVQDILLRNKGRVDRLKDPLPAVEHIVSRASTEDLMLFYNLPAFAKGDVAAFLAGVARANGFVKRGGVLDLTGASRFVLRDWSTGKLPRYAAPLPSNTSSPATDSDNAVLEKLTPRKEARRSAGLVRLVAGEVDTRPIALAAPWMADGGNAEDESDVEEAVAVGVVEVSLKEDSSEEEGEEDEEIVEEEGSDDEPVFALKRKRPSSKSAPAPPSKKVSFAATHAKSAKSKAPPVRRKLPSKPSKAEKPPPAAKSKAKPDVKTAGAVGEYDFTKFF
ncbi:hypothetical protein FA95DRAFT_1559247 [Auriscalpium vulgare]|uniref:Uncharacterized protein n=1 Tax=Auriscalpium vulgare TaxID=40419 RepID=A0ACB8RTU9_9AGAM|nr:hypothetical protein FA95DRAFT_1559247 [Auriscalpium vulgare]